MVKPLKSRQKVSLNRLEFVPARFEKQRPAVRNTGLRIVELNAGEGDMAAKQQNKKTQKSKGDVGDPRSLPRSLPRSPRSLPQSPRSPGGSRVKTRSQDELFPREELRMQWTKLRRAGSGLANLGNTCFMNSVLQCLVHTPALAELLLSGRNLAHKPAAHGELDPIGMTKRLVEDSLEGKKSVVSPVQHAKSLKRINRGFRLGRQEDAHEYLIALLDAMHDRSIAGMNPKPSRELEYTSFIYQIFGGKIRSQLKCTQCDYESNTYDPFLDLSLEISRAHSVQRALQRFTAGEVLDGQNSYKCPKQNKMVKAIKRMSIETAPNTLIIQLKRFEFSRSGRKISKHVDFDETIDLAPFMSHAQPKGSAIYDLYGILVHDGFSMHSGHYYSFLRSAGGEWHKFDDSRVAPSSARNAMGQQPYILFYVKRSAVAAAGEARAQSNSAVAPSEPVVAAKGKGKQKPDATKAEKAVRKVKEVAPKKKSTHQTPVVKPTPPPTAQETATAGTSSKSMLARKQAPAKRPLFSPSKRAPTRAIRSPGASLTPIARSKTQRGYNILPKRYGVRDDGVGKKKAKKGVPPAKKRTTRGLQDDSMDSKDLGAKFRPPKSPNATPKSSLKTASASRRGADALAASTGGKTRNRASLGLDTWNTIDVETKKRRDANMGKSGPSRGNKPDAYDAEYDKGRVKKVRKKGDEPGANNSKLFDTFQKTVKKTKSLMTKAKEALGGKKRKRST